jgi:hypothetical protein
LESRATLPKCLSCKHLTISNRIISPTDAHIPHLCGDCWNSPHKNSVDVIPTDKHNSVLINLITMETWVNGGCDIKECVNFEQSNL